MNVLTTTDGQAVNMHNHLELEDGVTKGPLVDDINKVGSREHQFLDPEENNYL